MFLLEFPGGPVIRTWYIHCQGLSSIPGQGTTILQAVQPSQKKKKNFQLKLTERQKEWETKIRIKNKGNKQKIVINMVAITPTMSNNHFKCQWAKCTNCKTEYHSGSKSKTLLCVVYKITILNTKTHAIKSKQMKKKCTMLTRIERKWKQLYFRHSRLQSKESYHE